jgi:hypothetical protein
MTKNLGGAAHVFALLRFVFWPQGGLVIRPAGSFLTAL